MDAFFYETTPQSGRTALLGSFLALAAKACTGLTAKLAGSGAATIASTTPIASGSPDSFRFNFEQTSALSGYTLAKSANSAVITASSPMYLTPATTADQAVWALKPTLYVVRNSNAQIKPGTDILLNPILAYQTETVSLPNVVWASVGPRQDPSSVSSVSGWKVNPTDNSPIEARLTSFLASLLGDASHPLDYDLDIVFSHVFSLDSSDNLPTKNVLNPITVAQSQLADPGELAAIIKKVLDGIQKTSNPARWVELDIKFRRHPGSPDSTQRMLIFHERFWFPF